MSKKNPEMYDPATDSDLVGSFRDLSPAQKETCLAALDCILNRPELSNLEYVANAQNKTERTTVSEHITAINKKMGEIIKTAPGRGSRLSLTDRGKTLADQLRQAKLLTSANKMFGEVEKIRVTIPASIFTLDSLIRELQFDTNSHLEIVGDPAVCLGKLRKGEADIALLWGTGYLTDNLFIETFGGAIKMVIVASSDTYFDSKSGECHVSRLPNQPLFLPNDLAHVFAEADCNPGHWDVTSPVLRTGPTEIPWAHFYSRILVESVEVALALVRANKGLAVVPADYSGLHRLRQTGLACSQSMNPTDVTLIAANPMAFKSGFADAVRTAFGAERRSSAVVDASPNDGKSPATIENTEPSQPAVTIVVPTPDTQNTGVRDLALSWAGRKSFFHPSYRLLPQDVDRYVGPKYSYYIKTTRDPATWYPEIVLFTEMKRSAVDATAAKNSSDGIAIDLKAKLVDWEGKRYEGDGTVIEGTCMTLRFSLEENSPRTDDHKSYIAVYTGFYQLGTDKKTGRDIGVWLGQWVGLNHDGVYTVHKRRPQVQATLLSDVPLDPLLIRQLSKINDIFKTMETPHIHPDVGREDKNVYLQTLLSSTITPRTAPPGPAAGRGNS